MKYLCIIKNIHIFSVFNVTNSKFLIKCVKMLINNFQQVPLSPVIRKIKHACYNVHNMLYAARYFIQTLLFFS